MGPNIRLARSRKEILNRKDEHPPRIYTPGDVLQEGKDFMKGHGTYLDDNKLKASVAGTAQQISKLLLVRPIKNRYNGEVGDVVVGRITDVQMRRWKVDTNARLDSVLLLSSVNLPGGELRRRSQEDEATMRKYLQEGDLISAEVQQVFNDGCLSLYTRSLKYGKLSQGVLVKVFPALIKRHKTHFHNFPWGTSVILGSNGYVFVYPTSQNPEKEGEGYKANLEKIIEPEERENVGRVRNCILALAQARMMLYDTSIILAFQASHKYPVSELLKQETIAEIVARTNKSLEA